MEYKVEENCIFCNIAHKKVPAKIILENEICSAFLDIKPALLGHCLIVPKNHFQVMQQADQKTIEALFVAAKKISNAMIIGLKVRGTNVFVANGIIAGQKAPHLIFHVIPRNDSNKLLFQLPEQNISEQELQQLALIIRKKIDLMLGKEIKETISKQEIEKKNVKQINTENKDELTSYLESYLAEEDKTSQEKKELKKEEISEEDLDKISELFK